MSMGTTETSTMARANQAQITVHPLSPALGAEIRGIDASQEVVNAEPIRAAWREHLVLLFRDQKLNGDEQMRFARNFGAIEPRHSGSQEQRMEAAKYSGHIDALLVSNVRKDGKPIGSLPDGEMDFHMDTCFRETPAKGALLYAMEVPKVGGDTMFLNLYKAYETLPDETKSRIAGRKALNVYLYGGVVRRGTNAVQDLSKVAHAIHPVVRTHPETGRKALYVNRLMTMRIEGIAEDESRALLAALFDHIEQPQFMFTHKWRVGDLLLWDNRCTLHARTDFSPDERRMLRRCSLTGDRPCETL